MSTDWMKALLLWVRFLFQYFGYDRSYVSMSTAIAADICTHRPAIVGVS
jgi:hypothetical protein